MGTFILRREYPLKITESRMNLGRSLKEPLSRPSFFGELRVSPWPKKTRDGFPRSVRFGSARQRKASPGRICDRLLWKREAETSDFILFFTFFSLFSTEGSRGQIFCEHARYASKHRTRVFPRLIVRQVPLTEFQRLICQAILFRPNTHAHTHTLSLSLSLSLVSISDHIFELVQPVSLTLRVMI